MQLAPPLINMSSSTVNQTQLWILFPTKNSVDHQLQNLTTYQCDIFAFLHAIVPFFYIWIEFDCLRFVGMMWNQIAVHCTPDQEMFVRETGKWKFIRTVLCTPVLWMFWLLSLVFFWKTLAARIIAISLSCNSCFLQSLELVLASEQQRSWVICEVPSRAAAFYVSQNTKNNSLVDLLRFSLPVSQLNELSQIRQLQGSKSDALKEFVNIGKLL